MSWIEMDIQHLGVKQLKYLWMRSYTRIQKKMKWVIFSLAWAVTGLS